MKAMNKVIKKDSRCQLWASTHTHTHTRKYKLTYTHENTHPQACIPHKDLYKYTFLNSNISEY